MAQATREIKRRIKSIGNTKKITKAMELVAATKMRKATARVVLSRDYAETAWRLVQDLANRSQDRPHPLLRGRPVKRVGILVVTSNRGLCGGFNQQIADAALNYADKAEKNKSEVEFICLGRKGGLRLASAGKKVVADFPKNDLTDKIDDLTSLTQMVINDYLDKKYDLVMLAYTDFRSALKQVPTLIQLLPLSTAADQELGNVARDQTDQEAAKADSTEYTFEPSAAEVLEHLLPRLLAVQIYQAVLESEASEHSARMVAMKNASEAATDMMDNLNLIFNRARQDSITQELAEISAGRAALE